MIKEITDVRERLAVDLQTTKGLIRRRTQEKIIAERTRDELKIELPLAEQALVNTRN
jgi:hypothetical protein